MCLRSYHGDRGNVNRVLLCFSCVHRIAPGKLSARSNTIAASGRHECNNVNVGILQIQSSHNRILFDLLRFCRLTFEAHSPLRNRLHIIRARNIKTWAGLGIRIAPSATVNHSETSAALGFFKTRKEERTRARNLDVGSGKRAGAHLAVDSSPSHGPSLQLRTSSRLDCPRAPSGAPRWPPGRTNGREPMKRLNVRTGQDDLAIFTATGGPRIVLYAGSAPYAFANPPKSPENRNHSVFTLHTRSCESHGRGKARQTGGSPRPSSRPFELPHILSADPVRDIGWIPSLRGRPNSSGILLKL